VRKWTLSACVALAWSIIVPLLAPAGPVASGHADQATTTTASITQATPANWPDTARAALAGAPAAAQAPAGEPGNAPGNAPASPTRTNTAKTSEQTTTLTVGAKLAASPATWAVRPGDTLSAIATALALPGGWRSLYAANRHAIGPDPNVIRPGTVLAVPSAAAPARYTVAPGDTLAAIATTLVVTGGWQRLYAANRQTIGPDPNVIRPGMVLNLPQLASATTARGQEPQAIPPGGRRHQAAPSRRPAGQAPASAPTAAGTPVRTANGAAPAGQTAPPAAAASTSGANATRDTTPAGSRHPAAGVLAPVGGMPQWLEDVLLAAGLLVATAFAVEPAAALARRRQSAQTARPVTPGALRPRGRMRRRARRAAARAKIILSNYDRLIVTYSADDHTVYVFTPPGEDPRAVLRAARLVLPEDTYEDLAGHLGVPSAWPRE
jgi:LysM repeat protein